MARSSKPSKIKRKKRKKNRAARSWVLFKFISAMAGIAAILLLLFFVAVRVGLFGTMPDKQELSDIEHHQATEVYSDDGEVLFKYFLQNRTRIEGDDIPQNLKHALIATEDARFYNHNGIDYKSLGRVLVKTILLGQESSGGGSTITQQLVKNLYSRKDYWFLSLPVNKLKEMITAIRLEEIYSKEKIITLYLNTVSFGENTYGLEAATERYFSKQPEELSTEEAAVIVGMLKATSYYNPRLHTERARERRNLVLHLMAGEGYLSPDDADSLSELPIDLNYTNVVVERRAPYLRQHLEGKLKKRIAEYNVEHDTDYKLYEDGLQIETTVNSRMQKYARKAVRAHMPDLQKSFDEHWEGQGLWDENKSLLQRKIRELPQYQNLKDNGLGEKAIYDSLSTPGRMRVFTWDGPEIKEWSTIDSLKHNLAMLNAGFVAMEPWNGHIKAWVGGIDYSYNQYDHVTSRRQVGSTLKPIVYSSALEYGVEPCTYLKNEQKMYDKYENWEPRNASLEYGGYYSMEGALVHSINVVSVNLLMKVGIPETIRLARNMGIKSDLPSVPSLALGSAELTLLELISAYNVFANHGVPREPLIVTSIKDQEGKVLWEREEDIKPARVLSRRNNRIMIEMLESVVDTGTAQSLRTQYGFLTNIAGKTGTSQNQADGWFVGVTPNLVAGAWVGADNPQIHFRSLKLGQGANTALPIWAEFMDRIYNDPGFMPIQRARFAQPGSEVTDALNCDMYRSKKDRNLLQRIFGSDDDEKEKEPESDEEKKGLLDKVKSIFN